MTVQAAKAIQVSRATYGEACRVAVICDFVEEQWPSMDLMGDMLLQHLESLDALDAMTITRLRPALRRRFTRIPFLPRQFAWNADRLMNRFADYPLRVRADRGRFDLFHLVDHSYAQLIHELPAERTVVTCHDLDTFRCLLRPELEKRPRWFRAMTQRTLEGLRKAAHVIAVSSATREELLRHRIVPAERISVIRNGVHPCCSSQPNPTADVAAARLFPAEAGDHVWLLSVGSTAPRKRLDVLLGAFAQILREVPNARLARVGGFTPAHLNLARDLNVLPAIVAMPQLDWETLAAVYRRSDLLLQTADAEGFGLPVVEAMACGCPVLASDIPVLREVGGAAATYCRVADPNAWKTAAVQLLRERICEQRRWELRREEGLAHAAQFSWTENARLTCGIYQEVLRSVNRSDRSG